MPTELTADQMKQFVRDHFEEFVNKRNAGVIRKNMSADFYDHDGPRRKTYGRGWRRRNDGRDVRIHAGSTGDN